VSVFTASAVLVAINHPDPAIRQERIAALWSSISASR
jgi:hypothetical protein